MSDPGMYRSKEEIESYKLNDPLEIASQEMLKKKIVSKKILEKINKRVINDIKDAAQFALESPFPDKSELYTNVYL